MIDYQEFYNELRDERRRLDDLITIIEERLAAVKRKPGRPRKTVRLEAAVEQKRQQLHKHHNYVSAAGRKKLAKLMRARWAKVRAGKVKLVNGHLPKDRPRPMLVKKAG